MYSATNGKEKKGNPLKSSRLGKWAGFDAVEHNITQSAKTIKDRKLKELTKSIITDVLENTRTRKQFEKELKKRGVDVIIRENKNKRVYGVTFIDHANRVALNGSRLGKEFSANAFEELFNKEKNITIQQEKHVADIPVGASYHTGFFTTLPAPNQETLGNDIYSVDQRKRRRKKRKI